MSENSTEFNFSMLLASAVHDMKNSLGMLLSSLDDMLEEQPPETDAQRKRYAVLQGESSRIHNDLVYLLGLYRLEQKQLHAHVNEVYVEDFLQQQLAVNHSLLSVRELLVTLDCEPGLLWFFDEELIAGVINNVLVNACRYTQNEIKLKADLVDGYLRIDVSDNGGGFPEDIINSQDASDKQISFGTGSTKLGLFFASEIARMHHAGSKRGYIELSNADGGGHFSIYLP